VNVDLRGFLSKVDTPTLHKATIHGSPQPQSVMVSMASSNEIGAVNFTCLCLHFNLRHWQLKMLSVSSHFSKKSWGNKNPKQCSTVCMNSMHAACLLKAELKQSCDLKEKLN